MAAFPQTITSQEPVDLGGGFEDPMDPCTMCQQGQMEIQQAYNDLTQTCNACQTQQNLKTLTSQGCQGCQQAQQVIQNVQNQSGGCSSCGQQTTFNQLSQLTPQTSQQTQFNQLMPQTSQNFLQTGLTTTQQTMGMSSQGLVQPMLTPLTGTGQQMLTTVTQQPGMMANQLPIAIERGATSQTGQQVTQQFVNGQLTSVPTTQGMVISNIVPTTGAGQPSLTQRGVIVPSTGAGQPMPVFTTPPPPPPPPPMQVMQVQQPVQPVNIPPPPPAPAPQPAPQPQIQVPQYTPAQIAGLQAYAQHVQPFGGQGGLSISGVGGIAAGVGGGTGKAPGATVGTDVPGVVLGGSGYGFGGVGIGGAVAGGPGAFDTHRPDLHAGGGWHNTLPMGALENVFNLY